ncbi:hypothetical protein E2C01_036975 [Portunus trituberculatus]|uniref:Uncharacterized protein n=1 Tax=Portunus trituberculatus TaxID=210409 RepID=A0A5B7F839_PORTR|nr:hypothetical protein [Portunus trituberculatus]
MAPKCPSASPAGSDMPKRERKTYTLEEKLEVLDRAEKSQENSVIQAALGMNEAMSMKILEENDPNIERSTAVIRGVMEKMTCYEVLLKEKQQKEKQQSITSFFRPHTPSQVTESETDDNNGDTLEEEVAK